MKNTYCNIAYVILFLIPWLEIHAQNTPYNEYSLLNVGLSVVDLDPDFGIPLAGYGSPRRRLNPIDLKNIHENCFFFKPSEGVHTPIRAKVMVIESRDQRIVLISIDVVGIEYCFVKDLFNRLHNFGIRQEDLIIAATHTHSGPGTLSRRIPFQLLAVDLFKFNVYEVLLNKVKDCVIDALFRLEPAELYSSCIHTTGLQRNKFRKVGQNWYDPDANLLLAKSQTTGNWLGGIVNFSVHGGGMPVDSMLYSSDFPGQIEIQLEEKVLNMNNGKERPVILFINGSEGDVATPERGVGFIEELGQKFISQSDSAIENLKHQNSLLRVTHQKLWLGFPALSLKYNAKDKSILKKSPLLLRVCLFPIMPLKSHIYFIEIGDIRILTWPGEPSTALGFKLMSRMQEHGYMNQWIFGLTNDYVGYFTNKEEYREGFYDGRSSLYNFRGGKRILNHYDKFIRNNNQ